MISWGKLQIQLIEDFVAEMESGGTPGGGSDSGSALLKRGFASSRWRRQKYVPPSNKSQERLQHLLLVKTPVMVKQRSGAVCDPDHSHGESVAPPQWPLQRQMVRAGLTGSLLHPPRRDARYRCHTRSHSIAGMEMKIAVNETAMIASFLRSWYHR